VFTILFRARVLEQRQPFRVAVLAGSLLRQQPSGAPGPPVAVRAWLIAARSRLATVPAPATTRLDLDRLPLGRSSTYVAGDKDGRHSPTSSLNLTTPFRSLYLGGRKH
jgi:hypothetical protein